MFDTTYTYVLYKLKLVVMYMYGGPLNMDKICTCMVVSLDFKALVF
jgi:hypothetical protein